MKIRTIHPSDNLTNIKTRDRALNIAAQITSDSIPITHMDDYYGGVALIFTAKDGMLTIRITGDGETVRYEGRSTDGTTTISGVGPTNYSYEFVGAWLRNLD